jgi:hypothetical protein
MFLFNSTRTLRGEGIIYTKVKRSERKTSWGKEAEEVKISHWRLSRGREREEALKLFQK